MASDQTDTGGYDCHFVTDPPDDLKCQICLYVAKDPHQHPGDSTNECGKVFCHSCISKYQTGEETCPNCRQILILFKDSKSSRQIRALSVKCQHTGRGCKWVGELGSLETHLRTCGHALVQCTNECKKEEQIAMVLRKDLDNHLENECPKRRYKCPHCKKTGEYQERTTIHLETCRQVKVSCPNLGCEESIPRREVRTHQTTCDYERVRCKYSDVGCEEKLRRKDLKEHEEDYQLHLRVISDTVLDLKRKAVCPKKIIKLPDFETQKTENKAHYSLPFYTSSNGYKMRITVYTNGESDAKGTYVSVYACLMKGDNDDSLTWPFTGTVTVELLNQLEDKNHRKRAFTFPADSEHSKRVVSGVTVRGGGWGYPQYISHADLSYKEDQNCQYLLDDTVVFRVSVEPPSRGNRPWLEGTQ